MRSASCAACEKSVPMGEAFFVAERTLCAECANKFLEERGNTKVKPGEITRLVDPTVCAQCAKDGGSEELPRIANLPVCETCDELFRNRPFPTWLKVSFAVFLCVAVGAFVYNMRFFLAYVDLVRGNRALENQQVDKGVTLLAAAAERVPEIPELATIPNLFKAGQLIKEEKNREALTLLEKTHLPPKSELESTYRDVELEAQLGLAFQERNFDRFLEHSQQLLAKHPNECSALGGAASAYACKYAETGDAQYRTQALSYWDQAKKQAGEHKDLVEDFENRLQHRLQTREIISRKEFAERYPNGWKPEEKK
jgi:hypothetical protein